MNHRGLTHHLVAYFSVRDLASNALTKPSTDPSLAGINPRPELLNQRFTAPVGHDDQSDLLRTLRV